MCVCACTYMVYVYCKCMYAHVYMYMYMYVCTPFQEQIEREQVDLHKQANSGSKGLPVEGRLAKLKDGTVRRGVQGL